MAIHGKWSKTAIIHSRKAVLIGAWYDLSAYYKDIDGLVWSIGVTGSWVNQGDYTTFLEKFEAGRYRGELI